MSVSDAEVEAAARVIAHSEEFNENLWPKYASVARRALEAAAAVRSAA